MTHDYGNYGRPQPLPGAVPPGHAVPPWATTRPHDTPPASPPPPSPKGIQAPAQGAAGAVQVGSSNSNTTADVKTLPVTGDAVLILAGAGLIMLMAGTAILVAARRARETP